MTHHVKEDRVAVTLEKILSDIGWCTDLYIINICVDLSRVEQFNLMVEMAQVGKLYNKMKMEGEDSPSNDSKMSVAEVWKSWSTYSKAKT